jgi:hypothetical protein
MRARRSRQVEAKQIAEAIEQQFGINPRDGIVNVEIIYREDDPEKFDRIRAEFEQSLATRADAEAIRRRSYHAESFAIHLQSWHPAAEISGIPEEHLAHYPVCTREEIDRIANPKSAADYLLALNANAISDTPRLKRLFLLRRAADPASWSLTKFFDVKPFGTYLSRLPAEQRKRCSRVPAGLGYLRQPNGVCIRSAFGDVVVVSANLKEYLYYMNLFLLGRQRSIPPLDCIYALMIATRTMFLTEAPDFDLDPRGKPKNEVGRLCEALVEEQLQFVIGHEYAHVISDHLGADARFCDANFAFPTTARPNHQDFRMYTPRQEQEFEADLGALLHQNLANAEVEQRINAAMWFFLGLDVLHAVSEYVNPSTSPSTHPDPQARILRLREDALSKRNLDATMIASDKEMRGTLDYIDSLKAELLKDFIPYRIDELEMYGSMYLPSYRGAPLKDRLDY